jgi:CHAD domain-containing protein
MRVGLRRFRSATKLFAAWAVPPSTMREELAWLGTVLGNARDHDVLLNSTLPAVIEDVAGEDSLRPLRERAGAVTSEKRAEVRRALHSARYRRCMLSLFEWVDCGGWRNGMGEDLLTSLRAPLADFARKAMARGHAKIEKRGKNLHRHDSRALHRLRIACKQNRYAVEFFRDLERGKRAAKYVKALSSLQDTLGRRNDLTVALRIVRELQEGIPELSSPAAFASGYLNCRATSGLRDVRKPWQKFSALSPAKLIH